MKVWIILIILALLVAPKAFAGETEERPDRIANPTDRSAEDEDMDERGIITVLLSHHHEAPTRKALEARSDQAREILFEIARDEEAFLFHRHRAIHVLAEWQDGEVYEFIHGLLTAEETEDGMRHHLLPALATGFGEEALEDLRPFLFEASDPQIRISAASAISDIPGDKAHELLLTALNVEQHPIVISKIESYATRLR